MITMKKDTQERGINRKRLTRLKKKMACGNDMFNKERNDGKIKK